MTPDFANTNHHDIYVEDPERQSESTSEASGLYRVGPHQTVSETGRLAASLEACPGVVKTSSAAGKDFLKKNGLKAQHDALVAPPGDKTFPVPEDERTAERSGLHITGRDSGVPVAADVEPGDTKDGSGEDKFKGIAAVEQGEVSRGDVPKGMETGAVAGGLNDLSRNELRKLARERGVTVDGGRDKSGKKKSPTKAQYVAALEGAVAPQTEGASATQKSEAVGPAGGTLTTDKDPMTAAGKRSRSRSRKRSRKK